MDDLDEVSTYIFDKIDGARTSLGFASVEFSSLPHKIVGWPNCSVIPGRLDRRPEASGRVAELDFQVYIYVLHAALNGSRTARTHEDLLLVRRVRNLLHADMQLGGGIAGSWVASESPRYVPTDIRVGNHVVTTEMIWLGKGRGLIA